MKIQIFKNGKGLIYGKDPKRIGCDRSGVLKIGATEVKIPSDKAVTMPVLFHGATGKYAATFTDVSGKEYALEKVEVHGGLIMAPAPVTMELMELRSRLDEMETLYAEMQAKITELDGIFDTNSLNFLIG